MNHESAPGVYRRTVTPDGWPALPVPTPTELAAASALVAATEPPTPMVRSEALSRRFGRDVHLKLELLSPIRSFKHRGALVAVDRIARDPAVRTIVTASTGNHGQGIAYAGRRAGLAVQVYAPTATASVKLAAMRALGADVRVHGSTLDEAQVAAAAAAGNGAVYVEDGENADLMAGAATVVAEMLDAQPALDTIIVPVGGGNLIAGSLLARSARAGDVAIVGVQSAAAPAATLSWLAGRLVEAPCTTFAGGLATTRPGNLALDVMLRSLERLAIVTDADLDAAMAVALVAHGLQLEGAAASPLAAMMRHAEIIGGDTIGLVVTGNWASTAEIDRTVALAEAATDAATLRSPATPFAACAAPGRDPAADGGAGASSLAHETWVHE